MGFLGRFFVLTMRYTPFYFIVNAWVFVTSQNAQYCTVAKGIDENSTRCLMLEKYGFSHKNPVKLFFIFIGCFFKEHCAPCNL